MLQRKRIDAAMNNLMADHCFETIDNTFATYIYHALHFIHIQLSMAALN